MNRHISEQYDKELETVRGDLMEMGGIVERQVRDASQAFVTHDAELAQRVRDGDNEINQLELAIDNQCLNILARRQPAATDLRLLITIMKVTTDLERVGDEAGRIAKMALAVAGLEFPADQYQKIRDLSNQVVRMFTGAMDTLARLDAEAAIAQIRIDEEVDATYAALTSEVDTVMVNEPETVPRAMCILWTARALERIGDHSKNVCEYVVFLVRGEDVRHPQTPDPAE